MKKYAEKAGECPLQSKAAQPIVISPVKSMLPKKMSQRPMEIFFPQFIGGACCWGICLMKGLHAKTSCSFANEKNEERLCRFLQLSRYLRSRKNKKLSRR
jgi:hypothetical protein